MFQSVYLSYHVFMSCVNHNDHANECLASWPDGHWFMKILISGFSWVLLGSSGKVVSPFDVYLASLESTSSAYFLHS